MPDPHLIPDICPVCNARNTIQSFQEATWSPPMVWACYECGWWGERPDDLRYAPTDWPADKFGPVRVDPDA